jgi:hypothetical protein
MRKILVPVFLLLIASSAFAGTITSLDPSSIKVNSGEYFITAFGTSPGNLMIFDGPAGHFERDVSATFSDRVVGWVPEAIVAKSGTYALKVRAANGVETNSLNFTVVGFKFFPLVLLVPDVMIVQPKTREGVTVKFDVFPVGGEDPNPIVECDHKSGDFFPMGITRIKCVATNSFKERAEAQFDVNVADQVGPIVTVPELIRVPARSNEGAIVDFEAKASDEIWGDMPVECAPKSGSMFRIGSTTVVCTSVDLDLNVGAGAFVIEVVGDRGTPEPLKLILPLHVIAEAKDPRGAEVSFDVKVENTKDPNPSINCSPKSGSLFPLGTTVVQCDALDNEGAWGKGTLDVIVLDAKPPEIRFVKASPDKIPQDGRLWPVTIDAEAVDDLDLRPTCAILGVTANENIDAGDEEKPEYDYQVTDALKVELRGESTHATRVYNVWVACSDFFGNMTQTYVQVMVSKDAGAQSSTSPTSTTRRRAGGKP